MLDLAARDLDALSAAWRGAAPFPHVILDDLLGEASQLALREAVAREAHWPNRSDFYEMMASTLPPRHERLLAFGAALGTPENLAAIARITGKGVARVDVRSYVYLAGSFLLPHSDHGYGVGRAIAWVYYLLPDGQFEGGELELFSCSLDGGDVVATAPALRIAPRGNRLVLFDVSDVSLHQVREVTAGGRVSLSGWYYP